MRPTLLMSLLPSLSCVTQSTHDLLKAERDGLEATLGKEQGAIGVGGWTSD